MPTTRPEPFTPLDWWHLLRPPVIGAALLSSYVAVRMFAFAAVGHRPEHADDAANVFLFAAMSGGVCGLVYSLLGRPLRRGGALGNYVAGIITVLPYFLFLFFLGPESSERADYRDPFWWLAALAASTLVGVFLGREFHEKDNLFNPDS